MSGAQDAPRVAPHMNITPLAPDTVMASYRTGTLSHTTGQDIIRRLGFEPTRDVTPECAAEWRFIVNGHYCSIWDMKGSGRNCVWSFCGPAEVFAALFGWRAVL